MTTDAANSQYPEFTQGDFMRKARLHAGLTVAQLAEMMGVSDKTVNNAELGRHKVRPITLNAWALATGVPRQWLETGIAPTENDGGDGLGADDETRTRNILLARSRDAQVVELRPVVIEWDREQAA